MATEADAGVMLPQPRTLGAPRSQRSPWRGRHPAHTRIPAFRPSSLQGCRRTHAWR